MKWLFHDYLQFSFLYTFLAHSAHSALVHWHQKSIYLNRFNSRHDIPDTRSSLLDDSIRLFSPIGRKMVDDRAKLFIFGQSISQLEQKLSTEVFFGFRHFLSPLVAARGENKNSGFVCLYLPVGENDRCSCNQRPIKQRLRRHKGDWIVVWNYGHYSQRGRYGRGRIPNTEDS